MNASVLSLAWKASLRKPDPTNPIADAYYRISALGLVGSGLRDYARAYYAYKDIWEARTGKQLLCQCENGKRADPFAVVAVKSLLHALPL